jgi:hypothetical protein
VAQLSTLGHVPHHTKIIMKTHRIVVGVIFTGLLTCSFLSGCAHEASTKTVAIAPGSSGTIVLTGGGTVTNPPASGQTLTVTNGQTGTIILK